MYKPSAENLKTNEENITAFKGYNKNFKIQENEFSDETLMYALYNGEEEIIASDYLEGKDEVLLSGNIVSKNNNKSDTKPNNINNLISTSRTESLADIGIKESKS